MSKKSMKNSKGDTMVKYYYLKDIDVSQLPLKVRKNIEMYRHGCAPAAMVGYMEDKVEPFQHENGDLSGEYFTMWFVTADDKILAEQKEGNPYSYWISVEKTSWVSPRIDKYLENIRINKEQVL